MELKKKLNKIRLKKKSKMIKKPSLVKILVKNIAVALIIYLLLFLWADSYALYENIYYTNVFFERMAIEDVRAKLATYIKDEITEEEAEEIKKYVPYLMYFTEVPAVIEVEGKELINTTNTYLLEYDRYDVPFNGVILMNSWKPEYEAVFNEICENKSKKTNAIYEYYTFIVDCYINFDTGDVYLGKLYTNKYNRLTGISEEVATYDLTPTDTSVLDGYKHFNDFNEETTETIGSFHIVGSLPKDSNDIDKYETGISTGVGKRNIPVQATYSREISNKVMKSLWTIGNVIVVVVLCVIAIVAGIIKFYKDKSVYDIFEYRKKTTNAMAHDLKTPLAIMSLSVSNLKENLPDNIDRAVFHANKIEENIIYTNKLIMNILDFSNSENITKLQKEKIEVSTVIEEYVKSIDTIIKSKNLTVEVEGADSIYSDLKIWKQAIFNLIDNAVKYSSEGGKVLISIRDNEIIISNPVDNEIKNTKKLLEPFVKGDESRGENTGSGLGLAVADNNLSKLGYKLTITCVDKVFVATIN